MRLDALLDNTDKNSKHMVMYDKQMHHITPQITFMLPGMASTTKVLPGRFELCTYFSNVFVLEFGAHYM